MSSAERLWEDAVRVTEPELWDTTPPEQRQEALEQALFYVPAAQVAASPGSSPSSSSPASLIEMLAAHRVVRKLAVRAVCDPWSSIRKSMIRGIAPSLLMLSAEELRSSPSGGASAQHMATLEMFLLEASGKVLLRPRTPWFAADGILGLLSATLQRMSSSSSSLSFACCQQLLHTVLPFVVHAQEAVRTAAADVSVMLLLLQQQRRSDESDSGNDGDPSVITAAQLERIVVDGGDSNSTGNGGAPAWWLAAIKSVEAEEASSGGSASSSSYLLEQGRIALANRGLGVAELLTHSTDNGLSRTMQRWASSEFASVRFGCAEIFGKVDFRDAAAQLSQHEVDRRLKLAVDACCRAESSSAWTVQETAAIAAGDLLRVALPQRFCFASPSLLQHRHRHGAETGDETSAATTESNITSPAVAACALFHLHAIAKRSAKFDVRRATGQLLPLLAAFFIASCSISAPFATSVEYVAALLQQLQRERDNAVPASADSAAARCDGSLLSAYSCCLEQDITWFWIIRTAFESSHHHTSSSSSHEQHAARLSSIRAHLLGCRCPRVALLLAVYGNGLFSSSASSASSGSEDATNVDDDSCLLAERGITTVLPCDVRLLADMLRIAPERAFRAERSQRLLHYALRTHQAEPHVQELVFTALHDAAHVLHHRTMEAAAAAGAGAAAPLASPPPAADTLAVTGAAAAVSGSTTPTASDEAASVSLSPLRAFVGQQRLGAGTAALNPFQHSVPRENRADAFNESNNNNTGDEGTDFDANEDSKMSSQALPDEDEPSNLRSTASSVGNNVLLAGRRNSNNNSTVHAHIRQHHGGGGGAHHEMHLPPFLFAMDARFAPPTLQQDGSDTLENGTAWVQALLRDGAAGNPSGSGSGGPGSKQHAYGGASIASSSLLRRNGSLVVARGGQNKLHNVERWSLSPSSSALTTAVSAWTKLDEIREDVVQLATITSELVDLLLNGNSKTSASLEHASLFRAADATRAAIRTFGSFVVVTSVFNIGGSGGGSSGARTSRSDENAGGDPLEMSPKTPPPQRSDLAGAAASAALFSDVLSRLLRPWMVRLDRRREIEKNKKQSAAAPKKASETNWDDDDDDEDADIDSTGGGGGNSKNDFDESSGEDDENAVVNAQSVAVPGIVVSGGGSGSNSGGVSTSVTWAQEVEAAQAAARHVSHVMREARRTDGGYEPERVEFVRRCVEELAQKHWDSCILLELV